MSQIRDEVIEESQSKVERFVSRFDPSVRLSESSYYFLACHAALPLVLTPELVNYIRVHFLKNEGVPWISEADLLLSNLCRPVGYELYVMDKAVRAYLLHQLKQDERFGETRIKEIARLLLSYVQHLYKTNPFVTKKELETQQWGAMLYLDIEQTVKEIARAISKCVDKSELARLLKITEDFKQEIASSGQFQDFLYYAQLSNDLLRKPETVKREKIKSSYQVAGLELTVPESVKKPPPIPELETFESFEFEAEVATIVFEGEKKKLNTILLVEDESAIVEEVSELLSSPYGITVRGTEDVNEVIKLAESSEIDLILINYDLPNSRYQGTKVDGIEIVRLLRANPNISHYLPIVGFSMDPVEDKFRKYADGFYDKNKVLNEGAEQDFINYLRKIFNRVKLTELLPYESAEDLDSVLDLIGKRHSEVRDTSEEDVTELFHKPRGDDGTFYLLENLRLLNVLIMTTSGQGPGTVRYDPSPSYLNQNSPRLDPPPDGDEFEVRLLLLYSGQKELLDSIRQANERKQDTSLADAAVRHTEEGDIATYRRLENLRLLDFLSITDVGTSRETIRYNLSQKYQKYLSLEKVVDLQAFEFETVTVNRRGETIKTETHTASYFTETLTDSVGLEMVAIPGGIFTMGSPENEGSDDERPQHQVTVSPFFMGKYPVTQAQWKAIASRTDLKVEIDLDPEPSNFKGDNRPVETVNWYEAVEFCQRLSKLTGRDYRLPSEAEWEYACRGVTEPLNLEKGESYPPFYFGETITVELANYDASSTYADEPTGEEGKETTPVGQFPPNAFGLYDMHGNVWEWCADDWHSNYQGAPTDGSAWLDSNEGENINNENESYSDNNDENEPYSLLRGGSRLDVPSGCRSATRDYFNRLVDRVFNLGFRVVCGFGRTL